jgi:cytochrome c oxidase cbb3-type subunit II
MAFSHQNIEKNTGWLIILTILIISVGGLVQIVPLFFQRYVTQPVEGLKPYSALELSGRDIYIREGCVGCHSQMVRPFRAETERYGHYSVAGEYVYDRPFLWGSKRTGPDLQRMAGRYSDDWHRIHLTNPRDVVPESNMPAYAWLTTNPLDTTTVQAKMKGLRMLGHPYTDAEIASAPKDIEGKTDMDALIAYLQSLGRAMKDVKQ